MSTPFAKLRNAPWLVFALVLAWKILLFAVSVQPVPANDSYFYDGAVIHQLLHGGYYNPSLALALPVSGTQVFCAYPPLYQAALWLWMSAFGTSAISAMVLHLVLFFAYALVVLAILRRLQTPVWCIHFAGAYLLLLTFHDRPDSLAHLLGMLAVYSWVRSRRGLNSNSPSPAPVWPWLMALFSVLTLCTSLQIGGIYFICLWFGVVGTSLAGKEKFPAAPMAMLTLLPMLLVALVKFVYPHLWSGFIEHASQTPSFTGLRLPGFSELLKVARTAPAILFVAVALPWSWLKQHNDIEPSKYSRFELTLIPTLQAALAVVGACLFILTANTVAIANYLQPLIVATYLAFCATLFPGKRWLHLQVIGLLLALLIGSVRAIGISTLGVACATDVSYFAAKHRIESELSHHPGATIVLSSAFLYDVSKHSDVTLIHSDWLTKARSNPPISDLQALVALKPQQIILTQFDYYRRYLATLDQLKSSPALKDIQVLDTARIRSPDSFPSFQKVLQNVSWAPVVVTLSWRDPK